MRTHLHLFLGTMCIALFTLMSCENQTPKEPVKKPAKEQLRPLSTYENAPEKAEGMTVEIKTTVDLAKELPHADGRILRMRLFTLAPGGKVPLHSHVDRPAVYYIIKGLYTEYRSDLDEPRILHAGDFSPEWGGYSHWVENRSLTDTLQFTSADVFNALGHEKLTLEQILKNYEGTTKAEN